MKQPDIRRVDRESLEWSAMILGDSSGAAKALAEAERREANGERVAFYFAGKTILVGPPIDAPHTQNRGGDGE